VSKFGGDSSVDLNELLIALPTGGPEARSAFDTRVFPLIVAHVQKRAQVLAADAAKAVGAEGLPVPHVAAGDLPALAQDVATTTLARIHNSSHRFDPSRGSASAWVLRACAFAFVDESRKLAGGRGQLHAVPTDPVDMAEITGMAAPDPADVIIQREQLEQALSSLTRQERTVFLQARRFGLTRQEIADVVFPHLGAAGTREVAAVLRRAERRLSAAAAAYMKET